MIDHSDQVRRAVIEKLKSDADVAALVGNRVYDQIPANPLRPFLYFVFINTAPAGNSCGEGSRVEFNIHGFTNKAGTAQIAALNAVVVNSLNENEFNVTGTLWDSEILGSRIMRDGDEANAHHGIVSSALTII